MYCRIMLGATLISIPILDYFKGVGIWSYILHLVSNWHADLETLLLGVRSPLRWFFLQSLLNAIL